MHWHADTSSKNVEGWLNSYTPNTKKHSSIIGFAFDGYPIYGSYGWDKNKNVKEITSSYKLKDGANGYNGIDDYKYIEDFGDLDKCNGRIDKDGEYRYYSTFTFPYIIGCYAGIIDKTLNTQTQQTPGQNNMRPGGQNRND